MFVGQKPNNSALMGVGAVVCYWIEVISIGVPGGGGEVT
jgi:hypothetical protein